MHALVTSIATLLIGTTPLSALWRCLPLLMQQWRSRGGSGGSGRASGADGCHASTPSTPAHRSACGTSGGGWIRGGAGESAARRSCARGREAYEYETITAAVARLEDGSVASHAASCNVYGAPSARGDAGWEDHECGGGEAGGTAEGGGGRSGGGGGEGDSEGGARSGSCGVGPGLDVASDGAERGALHGALQEALAIRQRRACGPSAPVAARPSSV